MRVISNSSNVTWNTKWIQEYESPWGIIEKFKYLNAIDNTTILELLGNKNVRNLNKISTAGDSHRDLIFLNSIDSNQSIKYFGIDLLEYNNELINKVIQKIPDIKNFRTFYRDRLSFCPLCLENGYHSIFH